MTWRQSGELIGQKVREISLKNMKRLNQAMWRLRVPNTDAPAGNLNFLRYPWVVSTRSSRPRPAGRRSSTRSRPSR